MGIPVWEFRSALPTQAIAVVDDSIAQTPSEQLLNCDWIVMIDGQHYGKQAQQLLHAMLFAIGVEQHQTAIIDSTQLAQLHTINSAGKVLIVLGSELAKQGLGDTVVRGTIHPCMQSQIATIVTHSLVDLLQHPGKKADAWQDLQLAKQAVSLS